MSAVGREPVHGRVAVPVRDVDLTGGRDRDIGRVIERRLEGGAPALTQRQHRPALWRELQDLVLVPVAEVHMVVRTDEDPVRIAQSLATPPGEKVAVGVEDQNSGSFRWQK